MRLYSIIISVCAALITTFTAVFGYRLGFGPWYAVLSTLIGIVAIMAFDCLIAVFVRSLPEKWFSCDKSVFVMKKTERKVMEKLGIRKWKEQVPDLGKSSGICKRRLTSPHDNVYVGKYLLESAYGQVIHFAAAVWGFVLVFLYPLDIWYCFGFPIAVVNTVLNLMSMFTLRYNFGRLKILYKYNERRERRIAERSRDTSGNDGASP